MADDFIAFSPSPERDPDGAKLRATFEAHVGIEMARAWRLALVEMLAGVSVLLWLAAAWPQQMARVRVPALAGWALCAAGLLGAAACEWHWRRKRGASLAAIAPEARAPPHS